MDKKAESRWMRLDEKQLDFLLKQAQRETKRFRAAGRMLDGLCAAQQQMLQKSGKLKGRLQKELHLLQRLERMGESVSLSHTKGGLVERLYQQQKLIKSLREEYGEYLSCLSDVERRIVELSRERSAYRDSEERFQKLLASKRSLIFEENARTGMEILLEEQRRDALLKQRPEVEAASRLGLEAKIMLDSLQRMLEEIEKLGRRQIFGAGREQVQRVKQAAPSILKLLSRFERELRAAKPQDAFLDRFHGCVGALEEKLGGSIADPAALHEAKVAVFWQRRQMDSAMEYLDGLEKRLQDEARQAQERIHALVLEG